MRQYLTFIFASIIGVSALISAPRPRDDLDDPDLDRSRREAIIRAQQEKWGVEEEPAPAVQWMDPAAILRRLLKVEIITFDPAYSRQLRLGEMTLRIPAGSFTGPSVEVRAIVLKTPADFALAGIPLEYKESGKTVVLQSDGMFHLEFLQNGKQVEPSSSISVLMQPGTSDAMNMYRLDGKTWTDVGSTGMVTDWPEGCDVRKSLTEPLLLLVESPYCEGEYPSVRIYRDISQGGWWNFDKPAENITCLTGTFEPPNEDFQIILQAAGMDYLGLSHARRKGKRFAVNVAADHKVKIYSLVTDRKSRSVYIGSLESIQSPGNTAFATDEDFSKCTDVGELKLKRTSVGLLTDRKVLLEAIGLPEGGL